MSSPEAGERPLLAWRRRGSSGRDGDEELVLGADGTAWLAVRVAVDPAREDRVGSFRAVAGPELLAAARRLAAGVATLAAPDGAVVATVEAGGAMAGLGPGVPGAAAELLALLDELTERALGDPVATCRFALVEVAAAAGPGLALVVANDGAEPVLVSIDPAILAVEWRDGAAVCGRDAVSAPPIGLVDRDGELLDGLFVPATIPARSTAALTLPLARVAGPAVLAEVGGWIALRGPGANPDLPLDRFAARTRPLALPRTS